MNVPVPWRALIHRVAALAAVAVSALVALATSAPPLPHPLHLKTEVTFSAGQDRLDLRLLASPSSAPLILEFEAGTVEVHPLPLPAERLPSARPGGAATTAASIPSFVDASPPLATDAGASPVGEDTIMLPPPDADPSDAVARIRCDYYEYSDIAFSLLVEPRNTAWRTSLTVEIIPFAPWDDPPKHTELRVLPR